MILDGGCTVQVVLTLALKYICTLRLHDYIKYPTDVVVSLSLRHE